MAAIGSGWAETAWVEAAWVTEAWDDVPYVEPEPVLGGVKKRKIKYVDDDFFPWTQQKDDILEEFIEDIRPKKRPKLKLVKKTIDFDDTLQAERVDRELITELQRIETERKKRAKRHKAAIMLLLS